MRPPHVDSRRQESHQLPSPTLEGAGVHLRRAFGFGDTSDFDPFLLFDDFRNDVPEDYLAGFPGTRTAASRPSRTCSPARSSTATASATAERIARRRHPVDDRRQRHHPSGDAERRSRRAGCTDFSSGRICPSALKMTPPRYQESKLPTSRRSPTTTARAFAWSAVIFGGSKGRWRGLPRTRPIWTCPCPRGKEVASGRNDAPCVCLRLRRVRDVLQRVGAVGGTDGRHRMVAAFDSSG